ncbi:hypothetical protein ACFS7Z_09065 [Pontibacter toksunensis]|uniref:Outer membrane protein beta-barrel domain-containing protein n=1 Tax=Pontibacter toksunensis TaxID=1332631 RepID=A0ABW6BU64_9BACT
MIKNILKAALLLAFLLFGLSYQTVYAQGVFANKDPGSLRASISYVWLSDFDSQGLMFNNRLHHYLGERFGLGVNVGMLSGSRYDESSRIYTIKSTYYMGGFDLNYDVLQNATLVFRVGAGMTGRHRSEINTDPEDLGGTVDGSVVHIRTADVGVTGFIENDFGIFRNGVAGGRLEYMYYTKGSPVLAIGLHVGFTF